MQLSKEIQDDIKRHALDSSPKECCGFILFHNFYKRAVAIKATNTAENQLQHVSFSAKEIFNIKFLGKLMALYHSHNSDNSFSEVDKKCYDIHGVPLVLFNNPSGKFSIYQGEEPNRKYINREFQIGKQDCFSLIIDYYLNELGVIVENFLPERDDNWHKKDINYIDKFFNQSQLVKISREFIQKDDIIVLDYKNNRFHFAIYLDNDLILHHPRGRKSLVEPYSDKYKKITLYALRSYRFNKK